MQQEIVKMCDLVQDLYKQRANKKKKKTSHPNCSKKQRIVDLENQVKQLQENLIQQQIQNVNQGQNQIAERFQSMESNKQGKILNI